ncbi:MAG: FliH/SctL family protein [Vampirovibrionia bacterium]
MSFSKQSKLSGNIIQYGQSYNVIGKLEDDLNNDASKKQLTKAQNEAQKLIQNALMQVEQTIAKAQEEAATILEQAKEDAINIQNQAQETGQQMGYDEGYQAGYNQAIEEASNIISSAETIIHGAYQSQKQILNNTEKEMLSLIIAIARKVIHKEIKTQPDIILRLTEAAIRELKERDVVKLMINPKSVELLTKASPLLVKRINSLEVIKIIDDKSVPVGGVIVESISGKIDAQVDTQIEEIYNKMLDEAAKNPMKINIPQNKTLHNNNVEDIISNQPE